MIVSDDPRIRFEVPTPHGRDDVQIDMPDGSVKVLSFEDIGVTKQDIQAVGIGSLITPLVDEETAYLNQAAYDLQTLLEEQSMENERRASERHHLSARLATLEDKISKCQYILDDVVSVSVWPDYIPKDPDLAFDPAAARAHNEHMFDGWEQNEIDGIQALIVSLQGFYEQKQVLQHELELLVQQKETYDLHGRQVSFEEARDVVEQRLHQAKRRISWLEDIAVQDTKFRSQEIIKKVEVAVPELEKQKSKARQLADSINYQKNTLEMLSADYREQSDKYKREVTANHEENMREIGKLQDRIYGIESFLEAVTPENLWNDLGQLANPNAATNPYEARKWLDELQSEPDKGKEILTASAELAKLYAMQNDLYAMVLQVQGATNEADDVVEEADADLKASEEEAFIADQQLSARERYFRNRDSWDTGKRITLGKSLLADIKDRNPLRIAATKLTAMGDHLYDAPVKLRLSQNPVKSTHFREMLALRAGYKLEGRGLKVNVLERPNENGNKCLCEIVGTDVITQLTIEVDPKQHYKLIASTCMNEDPLWTEAENDTPGVPPNLSTLERDKPKNLNQYIRYHELIKNNIDESREAAE